MDSINEQNPTDRNIARIIQHGIYHRDKSYNSENEDDDEVCMELDIDKPE